MVHIKGSNECCEDTYGPLHETPVKQAKNLMSLPNCALIEANLRLFSGESPVMHSFIRLLNLLETL